MTHSAQASRLSVPKFPMLFTGLTLVSALAWAGVASGNPLGGMVALVFKLVTSAWMPAVYLVASLGVGLALTTKFIRSTYGSRDSASPSGTASRTLALCVGVAAMLTLTHVLGWSGLLGGTKGPFVAWVPVVVGFVLALRPLSRWWEEAKTAPTPSKWWLLVAPAFGLMLACACSTPGWLWGSEFGGFDALSYHLQLPQEWMALGRVQPLHHNVYSYLPSYLETAFLHCSLLSFPPRTASDADWGVGLVAREGQGLIAAQLLHAMFGMLAALALGRAMTRLAERMQGAGSLKLEEPRVGASLAGALTAGLFAWTPWSIVTGTLAYNEMAMLLFAAGVVVALAADLSAPARWCVCAMFIGAACGAKLTAILFLGVPTAIALVAMTPKRDVVKPALLGAVVGAAMLSPWMVRNAMDSGNPVFPFAAGIFHNSTGGTGHWTAEQVARFSSAHHFSGSLVDRLRLSVLPTPDPGNPQNVVHRGLMHPQWGWLFPIAGLAVVGILPRWQAMPRFARGATLLLLTTVVVQLGLWLFTTHIQSRFLLPLLPACAALVGLCIALIDAHNHRSGAAVVLMGAQAFFAYNTLAQQNQTNKGGAIPLYGITVGASERTGQIFARGTPAIEDTLDAPQWLNNSQLATTRLLLVGDVLPLYYRTRPVYATTWDEHPLARVIAAHPDDPQAVSISLREEGYEFVLLNLAEIARYDRSGFLDPRLSPAMLKPWIEKGTVAAKVWDGGARLLLRPLRPEERDAVRSKEGTAPKQ